MIILQMVLLLTLMLPSLLLLLEVSQLALQFVSIFFF